MSGRPSRNGVILASALIFILAFGLRLWTLNYFPRDQIPPNSLWETGAVAINLAENGAFADPYIIPTGPTSHIPPLYVGTTSLVYRAFGTGFTGGLVRWILVLFSSALVCALLPWAAARFGLGLGAGIAGGLIGAIILGIPGESEYFTALAMVATLAVFLGRWRAEDRSLPGSCAFGVLLGISYHLQPALLQVTLGCVAFELWWRPRDRKAVADLAALGLGIVIACAPWAWRNYTVFGDVFFIRGNFGLELAVGNHSGAAADVEEPSMLRTVRHPRIHRAEAERIVAVGERRYMEERGAEAWGWIRENPSAYLGLVARRVLFFWSGSSHAPEDALARGVLSLLALAGLFLAWSGLSPPQRAALVIPLATYPVVYYTVIFMPRYAVPVRWVLLLLAGKALTEGFHRVAAFNCADS